MQISNNVSYSHQNSSQTYKINNNSPAFQAGRKLEQTGDKNKQKFNFLALAGAIIGTAIPVLIFIKPNKDKTKLLKRIMDTDFAEPKKIIALAGGSILGGLAGGLVQDKGNHFWNKIKEANFQMISNIICPLIMLKALGKASEELTKNSNKFVKWAASSVVIVTGVVSGVLGGAMISNKINNDLIKKGDPYHRKIKPRDFLIHVDDIATALAITGAFKGAFKGIDKLLPFLVLMCGYHAGKQE